MIRDLVLRHDNAGLPIVRWRESRGVHAPEAFGWAEVECRIVRDEGREGLLLFAARGTVRHGQFEEGKAWGELSGFNEEPAETLYLSESERAQRRILLGKAGADILRDNDRVITAEFGPSELPIHINCTDAPAIELQKIKLLLRQEFLDKRDWYIEKKCHSKWKSTEPLIETYEPDRHKETRKLPFTLEALSWVIVATIFGLGMFVVAWLVGAASL